MSEVTLTLKGGEKVSAFLEALLEKLTKAETLRVGFLEDATYPIGDGGARLYKAAYGLSDLQKMEHPDWLPRLLAWAAYQKTHPTSLHVAQVAFWNEFGTINMPARPAFRSMISKESGTWGDKLVAYLKLCNFDVEKALSLLGLNIRDALGDSIEDWPSDNSELTAYVKGFNKGLTDSGIMKSSVDFQVWQGARGR